VLVLGLASVFYIVVSIFFLQNNLPLAKQFLPNFNIGFPLPSKVEYHFWLNLGAIFLLFIVGFFAFLPNSNRMVIQSRKNWGVMLLLFVILCFFSFIFNYKTPYCLLLLIVPIAAFASNFFLYTKKLFFVYVVLMFVVSVIIINNYYWLKLT
jgi:hypothetical protein